VEIKQVPGELMEVFSTMILISIPAMDETEFPEFKRLFCVGYKLDPELIKLEGVLEFENISQFRMALDVPFQPKIMVALHIDDRIRITTRELNLIGCKLEVPGKIFPPAKFLVFNIPSTDIGEIEKVAPKDYRVGFYIFNKLSSENPAPMHGGTGIPMRVS
jgi:hypothetical protein